MITLLYISADRNSYENHSHLCGFHCRQRTVTEASLVGVQEERKAGGVASPVVVVAVVSLPPVSPGRSLRSPPGSELQKKQIKIVITKDGRNTLN